MNTSVIDWLLRFFKGALIGTGAILPGVSGGALAAVFGLYEKIIGFMAHPFRDFKKNVLYFIPVGFGALFGVFILSFALSYFLANTSAQMLWFFVGAIIGILPALYTEAGKNGRKPFHLGIAAVAAVLAVILLYNIGGMAMASMPLNFLTWTMAGGIFALGIIVPGLSPSNFLLILGMYKPMVDGIKDLDFSVIIPLGIGAVLTVLLLAKLFDWIFAKAYALMFHIILGIVLASTVMIIPRDYSYISLGGAFCAVTCAVGIALGLWMSSLEKKYK